jgi:hypothetical protein
MSDQDLIQQLSRIVEEQKIEISTLKESLQNVYTHSRIDEADLNQEASKAGAFYGANKCQGAPLDVMQQAINYAAHGFSMGVRWMELNFHMRRKEDGREQDHCTGSGESTNGNAAVGEENSG